MEKTIVIIDGNSLINRAYYAMQRPMITKDGIYTQGIYGFINMLTKIRTDYEPEYMAVAFDLKAPTSSASLATVPMISSASKPSSSRIVMFIALSTSFIRGICIASSGGIFLRPALYSLYSK